MNRSRASLGAVLTLLAIATAACASDSVEPGEPPNIVLVSIDSLRADHLGTYGYPKPTSPFVDELADESVVFERAVSTTSWTLPAHLSMLTSLSSAVHGVINDGMTLSEDATSVAQLLQRAGWATGAVVSAPYLSHKFGFDRGFDVYDDTTVSWPSDSASHTGVTSLKTHNRAVELLDELADRPFFLFLHYWDVHYDFEPPFPFDTMFVDPDYQGSMTGKGFQRNRAIVPGMDPRDLEHVIALYDGEIAFVDTFMGRLFRELKVRGLWDNTLIIFTSDHGEEFLEHGKRGHRKNLYTETLSVPLIVKFPNSRWAGSRVQEAVGIIDIMPTMLDLAGLEPFPEANGRSLIPVVDGTSDPDDPFYYFGDMQGELKSVVAGRYKLIRRFLEGPPTVELYDTIDDPGEHVDIAETMDDQRAELDDVLRGWLDVSAGLREQLGLGTIEYDPEMMKALRSLGYIR